MSGKSSSTKGSQFERRICGMLSRWWTNDPKRDDVFWRSSGSGARAKTRGRRNRYTYGQSGDITAVDPIGAELISMFTFELKKGYNAHTLGHAIDRLSSKPSEFENWILQARESAGQAGSKTWALITQRDRRECLITMPRVVHTRLYSYRSAMQSSPMSNFCMAMVLSDTPQPVMIATEPLEEFLDNVEPDFIRRALRPNPGKIIKARTATC